MTFRQTFVDVVRVDDTGMQTSDDVHDVWYAYVDDCESALEQLGVSRRAVAKRRSER